MSVSLASGQAQHIRGSGQQKSGRQRERAERSTKAVLDAASDLIVEGGFQSLTFAAIGNRAGYSRGLVTSRFGSKDGLVEALIDRIVTTWSHRNVLPMTKGKSGLDGLLILLDAIRAQADRDPRGLRVLYALMFEAIGPDLKLRSRFALFHASMRDDVAAFVRKGQRDGTVRAAVDAEKEAVFIVAALRVIGYQWLLDQANFDPVTALLYLQTTTAQRIGEADRSTTTHRQSGSPADLASRLETL
jgi:AcrR family transcriptional regulator